MSENSSVDQTTEDKPAPSKATNPGNQPNERKNKKKEKKGQKYEVKAPKGTRDLEPFDMFVHKQTFAVIEKCFKRHGAVPIDTPVFELKDVLTDKYGEDSKLIYELEETGEGEKYALRYDLTVPFARYIATHGLKQIKRYHIGKVYRRDEPILTKGRYREFYQCDYDIAGIFDPMLPDADCLRLAVEILTELDVGDFVVKVSHRKILDGIFALAGVPDSKFRAISSAVDKLDKKPWAEVKCEMIEKGVTAETADHIGKYVCIAGAPDKVMGDLLNDANLLANPLGKVGIEELNLMLGYLKVLNCVHKISFDLSLARGLDYYTGVIFEAINMNPDATGIGSILGGGRYDGLVGKFGSHQVPSVGFSVGVQRILAEKMRRMEGNVRQSQTDVLVVGIGNVTQFDRLKLCQELWDADVSTEFVYKVKPSLRPQLDKANQVGIPFVAILGDEELQKGEVQVKNMKTQEQVVVKREDIGAHFKKILSAK